MEIDVLNGILRDKVENVGCQIAIAVEGGGSVGAATMVWERQKVL